MPSHLDSKKIRSGRQRDRTESRKERIERKEKESKVEVKSDRSDFEAEESVRTVSCPKSLLERLARKPTAVDAIGGPGSILRPKRKEAYQPIDVDSPKVPIILSKSKAGTRPRSRKAGKRRKPRKRGESEKIMRADTVSLDLNDSDREETFKKQAPQGKLFKPSPR